MEEGQVSTEGAAVQTASGWGVRPARRAVVEGHRYSRRYVLVPEEDVLKKGRHGKVFGYNVRTVARLAGITTSSVSREIAAGKLKIHDLASILRWVIHRVKGSNTPDLETTPPLWRFFDNYSLIAGPSRGPQGQNQIYLAVTMPGQPASEEMVRLFWGLRRKLVNFRGGSHELASRMFELDGIDPASLPMREDASGRRHPHPRIRMAARTLRRLVTLGVLVHDPETKSWAMAPFPDDIEGVTAGLRAEGFEDAEIVERHVVIGRDMFSLSMARRLLAYMRTNRLKAPTCGRDRRLWIVNGMDRAFHGYKQRKVFRRVAVDGPEAPAQPA